MSLAFPKQLTSDRLDVGQLVVRGLALTLAMLMVIVALFFAKNGGVWLCLGIAALFGLAAVFPWGFGQVVGGLILLVAFVVGIQGPGGEVGLSAYGLVRAVPLVVLGGIFMRPNIITLAFDLFRPQR